MDHGMMTVIRPEFWDYLIVAVSVILVVVAAYLFVKGFFRPGEREADHIKRKILQDEVDGPGRDH